MGRKNSEEAQLQWEEIILKQRQSKLSIASWCFQNKIAVPTFYYWKNKLSPKSLLNRNAFTEVIQETDNKTSGVSLEYHGIKVHLNKHFETSVLQSCLEVLKQC